METRLSSNSLQPLISFLAYLDKLGQKLWLKTKKLDENLNPTKGDLGHFG